MRDWEKEAIVLLEKSLKPFPQELNELDWKLALSEKTEKLSQHLSAFSNYRGGGYLVFGIDNGRLASINEADCEKIIKTLGNIARSSLVPAIVMDHSIMEYEGATLLFVKVAESREKPVYLRSGTIYDSYIRSAGETRRLEKAEVATLIATSQGLKFEDGIAARSLNAEEVLKKLDFTAYFDLAGRRLPAEREAIMDILLAERLVSKKGDSYDITNLGAILFAKNIKEFDGISRKAVRVIIYKGRDRLQTEKELDGVKGYATGFKALIEYINNLLPANEVIREALRADVRMYPEIAIRELVANALIHQDFCVSGTGPMVEVFSDRIEMSNPGRPLVDMLRLLDAPPQSRNEKLANIMRQFNICEERGSGVDKVVSQTELFQLPAPEFIKTDNHFKVILFAHKAFSRMNKEEKMRACYLHCCLRYVSGDRMNNTSLRERFKIDEGNYPIASKIISDTMEAGLVKLFDVNNKSKRYVAYVPFWA